MSKDAYRTAAEVEADEPAPRYHITYQTSGPIAGPDACPGYRWEFEAMAAGSHGQNCILWHAMPHDYHALMSSAVAALRRAEEVAPSDRLGELEAVRHRLEALKNAPLVKP